jgi:chromosomal replication initiation ATPase DnaA
MAQLIAAPAIVVEDIDRVAGLPGPVRRQVETVLFHLYNLAAAETVPLLFTGRTRPAHWQLKIPDLASRVLAMAHVRVAEPDDALLTAILEKLFHDRQMQVGPDVLEYLLRRIERSFASAERIVARLDQAALATKRGITRPLAVEVLAEDASDP